MKDLMKDKLLLLANTQELMVNLSEKMSRWDESQLVMEMSAFHSLNLSDDVQNLSKNGGEQVGRLLECCRSLVENPCAAQQKKVTEVLEELLVSFDKIKEASVSINEASHRIEEEAAVQKEIEEDIKVSLSGIAESIDTAAACAEFMMSDF